METLTGTEILKNKSNLNHLLHSNIMNSIGEAIKVAKKDEKGELLFDFKIEVNGIEIPLTTLSDVFNNIEKVIDTEVEKIYFIFTG